MTTLILFLLFCQTLGAWTGAFTAIWGEIAYIRAMRDGRVDRAEREHLNVIAHGLRFGMTLLLLASFGLIIVSFITQAIVPPALTASYWIFITLALLIVALSWALSRRHVSFSLGSSAALTAWWLLAYLTIGRLPVSYGAAVALYLVLTAVLYAALRLIRHLAGRTR
jgi:hypothetical protein